MVETLHGARTENVTVMRQETEILVSSASLSSRQFATVPASRSTDHESIELEMLGLRPNYEPLVWAEHCNC